MHVGQIPGFEKIETLKTLRKCDQHDSSLNDLTYELDDALTWFSSLNIPGTGG